MIIVMGLEQGTTLKNRLLVEIVTAPNQGEQQIVVWRRGVHDLHHRDDARDDVRHGVVGVRRRRIGRTVVVG